MGFKAKRLSFTYGSSDFPNGATSEAILVREQCIVKTVAQTLIDFNIGWEIDTAKCSSLNDFKPLPDAFYNESRNTALFLVNSQSGCKLLVGYIIGKPNKGLDIEPDCYVNTYNSSYPSQSGCVAGLIFSVIPGESSDTFGTTASDLIPVSATRVTGTLTTSENSSLSLLTVASVNAQSGTVYYYVILATNNVVGILTYDPNNLWPRCFCGKILGSSVDDGISSLYGSISFKVTKETVELIQDYPNATSGTRFGNANNSSPYSYMIDKRQNSYYMCGGNCVRNSSGNWISNTANSGVCLHSDFWISSSTLIHNDYSASLRWSPFYVLIVSNNLNTYGAIPGDGVKGILDTSLFRSTNFGTGALSQFIAYYADKTWVAMGEGLLLAWEPTNEDIPGSLS